MDSVAQELAGWLDQMDEVDPDVEAARQRIGRLSRAFVRVLEGVAAEGAVSLGDLETLSVLRRNGGSATPGEIARALRLTSGSVATRLRRLEAAGLAEPDTSERGDGRVRRKRLTPRGLAVWREGTARRTAREAGLFADLRHDDLAGLNATLERLLERCEREVGAVSRHDHT